MKPSALTKAEIAERIHNKLGISRKDARNLVDLLIETMMKSLVDPKVGSIKIPGFGAFIVRRKAARMGRNPATSEKLLLARRRVLVFRPSQLLKKAMNRDGRRGT